MHSTKEDAINFEISIKTLLCPVIKIQIPLCVCTYVYMFIYTCTHLVQYLRSDSRAMNRKAFLK